MANEKKTIVCLANSRKNGGRCVAGLEWDGEQAGDWIRPVSNLRDGRLRKGWLEQNGGNPALLSKIKMSLSGPEASEHQPENWLFDEADKWLHFGPVRWDELHKMADPVADLWGLGHETKHGKNNKIDPDEKIDRTLRLVKVPALHVSVFWNWVKRGKGGTEVWAKFRYNHNDYRLKVTDVHQEEDLKNRGEPEYEFGECYLTISIVGPYDNEYNEDKCRYGLVAAIIPRPA